jgi:type VI secretion system protein ImpC
VGNNEKFHARITKGGNVEITKPLSFGKLEIDLTIMRSPKVPVKDEPFRIAILGDFSGRDNRKLFKKTLPHPIEIDRDNFDEVMTRLGVKLNIPVEGKRNNRVSITFNKLDDFHPDGLFERLELFQKLKQLRKKLYTPSAFAAAAAEVRSWSKTVPVPVPVSLSPAQGQSTSVSNLLVQMLEQTTSQPQDDELRSILKEVVRPHLVPREVVQKAELIERVDEEIGKLMRAILHNGDFQAIEATWRALYFLVKSLETDTELKLFLFDLSKAELEADLNSSEDLRETEFYRLIVEKSLGTPDEEPWALVVGNYSFKKTLEDTQMLGRIAKIASQAGASFISAASPQVLGCKSLITKPDPKDWKQSDAETQAWDDLRQLHEASYIGLILPRFLLRLPYAPESDPIEEFVFREMSNGEEHEKLLWGNPAFACAYLLGKSFSKYGWEFYPGVLQEIDDLPMYVFGNNGEMKLKPCAEVLLSQKTAETILESGLMLLLSFKERDIVRLARFQSLTKPLSPLAGRWKY